MAKKKRKRLAASHYDYTIPVVLNLHPVTNIITAATPEIVAVQNEYVPWTRPENQDMSMGRAYLEYTGFPAMITGGLGAFGFNVVSQAGQVKTGTSIFSAAKYGFGFALLLESIVGALIFAAIFTVIDPGHHWEGGLDELKPKNLPTEAWDTTQPLMQWRQGTSTA